MTSAVPSFPVTARWPSASASVGGSPGTGKAISANSTNVGMEKGCRLGCLATACGCPSRSSCKRIAGDNHDRRSRSRPRPPGPMTPSIPPTLIRSPRCRPTISRAKPPAHRRFRACGKTATWSRSKTAAALGQPRAPSRPSSNTSPQTAMAKLAACIAPPASAAARRSTRCTPSPSGSQAKTSAPARSTSSISRTGTGSARRALLGSPPHWGVPLPRFERTRTFVRNAATVGLAFSP